MFVVRKEQVAWDANQRLLSGQDPNALDPFLTEMQKRLKEIHAEKTSPAA